MSDGFYEFGFGEGDNKVGKKSKKFDPETGRTYRASFVWFKKMNSDGTPDADAGVKFTGCERCYKQNVGYFLYKGPGYSEFGTPKQAVATIIAVWPTDSKGKVEAGRLADVQIMPWIFSADKYEDLSRQNDRYALTSVDYAITCTDSKYKKMTFAPEKECLMTKLLTSGKDDLIGIAKGVLNEVSFVAENIKRELARDLSIDQIREIVSGLESSPSDRNRNSADVDSLLDGILG